MSRYSANRFGPAVPAESGRSDMSLDAQDPPDPQRLRLVLVTDLVDSTQFTAAAGDVAARAFWTQHDDAGRDLIRLWRGVEVGRSDGFLVLFDAASDGLGFALGYHAMLAAWPAGAQARIKARVGAHWGPITLRRNRPADVAAGAIAFEIDGLALPLAARVMSAASPGQSLFSASAVSAFGASTPAHERAGHGHWRLKGVADPVELVELFSAGVLTQPPVDTEKAYRVVPRDGLWVALRDLPGNLGREPDTFVGREDDLRRVAAAFDGGARLVTLLGPGGMGKTRLAQRYARGWLGDHAGGAWFCDLAPARSTEGIVAAVAQALDVPLGRADAVQQLGTAIAARGNCLLVLDNFEHLTRHAAALVGAWQRAAPQARLLVTSRELLALPGEHVLPLEPLSAAESSLLFGQRLRSAGLAEPIDSAAVAELLAAGLAAKQAESAA